MNDDRRASMLAYESFAHVRHGESDLTAVLAAAMDEGRPFLGHPLALHSAESIILGAWDRRRVQHVIVSLLRCTSSHALDGTSMEMLVETAGDRVYIDVVFEAGDAAITALEHVDDPRPSTPPHAPTLDAPNEAVAELDAMVRRHGGRLWAAADEQRIVATLELCRHQGIVVAEEQLPFLQLGALLSAKAGAHAHGTMRAIPSWAHHVRDPRIRALLTLWRALDTDHIIPRIDTLRDARLCAWQHEMCFARVQQIGHEHLLSLDEVGGALERRIGVVLSHTRYVLTTSPQSSFIDEFVRRYALARVSGTPQFDYAQFALENGAPERFERLVLPFSESGAALPTHFVAMMRFGGVRTAERRHFIRMVTNHDA